MYTGIIVEESLKNPKLLKKFEILKTEVEENPHWTLHTVRLSRDQVEELSHAFISDTWYSHFWQEDEVVVVFQNKVFNFKKDDLAGRREAVFYGMMSGIPEHQLDFPTPTNSTQEGGA